VGLPYSLRTRKIDFSPSSWTVAISGPSLFKGNSTVVGSKLIEILQRIFFRCHFAGMIVIDAVFEPRCDINIYMTIRSAKSQFSFLPGYICGPAGAFSLSSSSHREFIRTKT
jgi:hypothetical protein